MFWTFLNATVAALAVANVAVAVAIYATTWVRARFAKGHAAKFRLWAECERKLSR